MVETYTGGHWVKEETLVVTLLPYLAIVGKVENLLTVGVTSQSPVPRARGPSHHPTRVDMCPLRHFSGSRDRSGRGIVLYTCGRLVEGWRLDPEDRDPSDSSL